MRILLWHGYLLSGSGSNVYTANLARAWRAAGHQVVVMCQERRAEQLEFVDAEVDMPSELPGLGGNGHCLVVRPYIGGLLPVYVYDDYEGFEVKTFVDLTDNELAAYTEANVRDMVQVIGSFRPDAIITGHEVMGPFIARQACRITGTEYAVKLHGSALEFAVKKQDRYRRYAVEGLTAARAVIGGSHYMVAEAAKVVPGWLDRATVVNPGCDTDLFAPAPPEPGPPIVGFVGKLIASKGIHDFLLALGLVQSPDVRVVIVGYGGFEVEARALAGALRSGDRDQAAAILRAGEGEPMTAALAFLESQQDRGSYFDRMATIDIEFTGRLEHGPLSALFPSFDVFVAPSVVPEAFGMVVAEAAACAVLPVVPDHSGIGEAGRAVESHLGQPGLLTYDPGDPLRGMAKAIDRVLALEPDRRRELGLQASALAHERWAWPTVADGLLTAATGR